MKMNRERKCIKRKKYRYTFKYICMFMKNKGV